MSCNFFCKNKKHKKKTMAGKRRLEEAFPEPSVVESKEEKKPRVPGSGVEYYCENVLLKPKCRAFPARFRARAPAHIKFYENKMACDAECLSPEKKVTFTLPTELQALVGRFLGPKGIVEAKSRPALELKTMFPQVLKDYTEDTQLYGLYQTEDLEDIYEMLSERKGLGAMNDVLRRLIHNQRTNPLLSKILNLAVNDEVLQEILDDETIALISRTVLTQIVYDLFPPEKLKESKIAEEVNMIIKLVDLRPSNIKDETLYIFNAFLQLVARLTRAGGREERVEEAVSLLTKIFALLKTRDPKLFDDPALQMKLYNGLLGQLCSRDGVPPAFLYFFENLNLSTKMRKKLEQMKPSPAKIRRHLEEHRLAIERGEIDLDLEEDEHDPEGIAMATEDKIRAFRDELNDECVQEGQNLDNIPKLSTWWSE